MITGIVDDGDEEPGYDILTFDPRGVGYSVPSAHCFDSVLESQVWDVRVNDLGGVLGTDEMTLGIGLAGAKERGRLCAGGW